MYCGNCFQGSWEIMEVGKNYTVCQKALYSSLKEIYTIFFYITLHFLHYIKETQ